ncbi:DinB family protein [Corynebacterium glyciniphilum]|uniref:DinB family protein n=1 Tax=Corynebacterium glyciniphilum TaxID=1404244 RepID=UPI003DA0FE3E
MNLDDTNGFLLHYLQASRDALLWKVEGVSEYDARRPLTATGTNLAGLVKHVAHTEIGYFGETLGREWPVAGERITVEQADVDPHIDLYLAPDETVDDIIAFYRRVWEFSNETLSRRPVSDVGTVPHWPADRRRKSLGEIATHVIAETARHAGHADILREQLDGSIGLRKNNTNLPDEADWSVHAARLQEIAERFR